jgi:uncharacterized metal-binding protein YceD (DUF177 family)
MKRNTSDTVSKNPADAARSRYALRVADLSPGRSVDVEITPEADARDELARRLDLLELRKLRFIGTLRPLGRKDWELSGRLGATVVQPCVATLDPVTTRIDTDVVRRYLADFVEPVEGEAEMPEDEAAERLGQYIDPAEVMAEELALALPLYPRSDSVEPVTMDVTEPGKTPMTDADAKPFAGLAELRGKLRRDGE